MLIKLIVMGTAILIICSVDLSHLVLDDSTERLLYFTDSEEEMGEGQEGVEDSGEEVLEKEETSNADENVSVNSPDSTDVKDSKEEKVERINNDELMIEDDFADIDIDVEAADLLKEIHREGGHE